MSSRPLNYFSTLTLEAAMTSSISQISEGANGCSIQLSPSNNYKSSEVVIEQRVRKKKLMFPRKMSQWFLVRVCVSERERERERLYVCEI